MRAGEAEAEDAFSLIEEYYDCEHIIQRDSREKMTHNLNDAHGGIWIFYSGAHPAGCVLFRPLLHLGSAGEVKRLYVRPQFRRQGIAEKLMEAVEAFASDNGQEWLYLDTNEGFDAAIRFYESKGYLRCPRYNDNQQATIFMRKRLDGLMLRPFEAGDERAFADLNEAWISKFFVMEEKDRKALHDPLTHILQPGGHIYMASKTGRAIGCCALLAMDDGAFEVAKMAVAEEARGRGIGRRLLNYAAAEARRLGCKRLYLESNWKLGSAVHLYESVGFRHLAPERVKPSAYARADVYMEMLLG